MALALAPPDGVTVPRTAVFCSRFLAYSQTFIYDEVRSHVRYEVEVFCRGRLNPEGFAFAPVHVAGPLYPYTRASRRFDRLFAERRYDVVHAHFGTVGVNALRYARRFARPLVVTFHGFDVPLLSSHRRFHPRHWGYALLGPRVLRHLTLGLCVSRELLAMLEGYGVPRDRLRLHRIGVDLTAFGRGPRDPATPGVVMVGRFVAKKGFEYGLRAFARAAAATSARLTVIGGGAREGALRRLVNDLGIASQVEFAGVLPHAEVARHLSRSDVLIAPSVRTRDGNREGGLTVAKEASASEAVTIGTLHGGIPEIVQDGVTGFLVPEGDVPALADRLSRVLADPGLRATMGQAARVKMEREYGLGAQAAALESFYDEARELLADRRRAIEDAG